MSERKRTTAVTCDPLKEFVVKDSVMVRFELLSMFQRRNIIDKQAMASKKRAAKRSMAGFRIRLCPRA